MGFRRASTDPISVEDAQSRVLSRITRLDSEEVDLAEAMGRVLRERVIAPFDVPEGDNSAMDGYAVIAADTERASKESPAILRVGEDIPAGCVSKHTVKRGSAARIMTGALMPEGADAVVQVEWTDAGEREVRVFRPVKTGANVRLRGEDMFAGATVLSSGTLIGAGEIGVLASVQKRHVVVTRRPIVSIISTGDELVAIDEPRGAGQVVNSNAWSIAALVREAGGLPRVHEPVGDDRQATLDCFRAALESDFVISTGGVSAGAYDYVHDVLASLGAETHFAAVAMKPGKPIAFSTVGERCIFSLPGNPVSCMVGFVLFVAPAMRVASGRSGEPRPPVVFATLADSIRSKGDRRTYIRVRVTASATGLLASSTGAQGSGVTTSMLGANGLAWIEQGVERIEAGERVPVVLLGMPEAG